MFTAIMLHKRSNVVMYSVTDNKITASYPVCFTSNKYTFHTIVLMSYYISIMLFTKMILKLMANVIFTLEFV